MLQHKINKEKIMAAPSEVNSKIKFISIGKGLKKTSKQKKTKSSIWNKLSNRNHSKFDIRQPRFQILKVKKKIPNNIQWKLKDLSFCLQMDYNNSGKKLKDAVWGNSHRATKQPTQNQSKNDASCQCHRNHQFLKKKKVIWFFFSMK